MIFKDLESLKQYLKQDAEKATLNPVRFINVDSMAMWVEVKKHLISLVDETTQLSKFCENEDTTPNINRVASVLKKANTSQLVTPLSEYLRIIPQQAESIIQKFIKADYQNNDNGKLRIYFLMYRMKSLLLTLPNDDPRTKDCIVLFETNEESDYKLTIVQKELNISLEGNEIDGFKSYLEYWEANPDKPIILHTGNAIHFEKNHFFDNVHVIVSSYDLIKYRFGLPSNITEDMGEPNDWNQLIKSILIDGSFEDACCTNLSINKYSTYLYKRWEDYTDLQKWLLWLWAKTQASNSYEIESARKSVSVRDFIDSLYTNIVNYINNDNYLKIYNERLDVLLSIKSVPPQKFWNKIDELDIVDRLSCLTCLSDIERKKIFELISELTPSLKDSAVKILKFVYPQLYYYIQKEDNDLINDVPQIIENYISEYRWLKATDKITGSFIEKVKEIAITKGTSVFEMQSRNYYIDKHYDEKASILFIDGMGIEYIDYLSYLFSMIDKSKYSVCIEAGYCTLPSTTELNKDFLIGKNTIEPPVRELDELKHSNISHPQSLIQQLNILEELKNRVMGLLSNDVSKIIIATDHGTSRMAVKVRNTNFDNKYPKPENIPVYKYGRFCEGNQDEEKYPTAICYNDKLVFADYSRFVQSGAPIDEIHGGASIEEWVVPIVTIEKNSGSKKLNVTITPISNQYKPDIKTKEITVSFRISKPIIGDVVAKVKGNNYKCLLEDNIYSFSFIPNKNDVKLNVKITCGELLGQFEINIDQGIKKNSNFDI